MAMWDIECPSCGLEVDDFITKSDGELPYCHVCNHKMQKKPLQKTSFILKGGGWARDGYRSPKVTKNNQR